MRVRLPFNAADFGDPDSRSFDLDAGDETRRLFVVKRYGRFYAYLNSCPHTGGPLNWQGDRFLSRDHTYIQCTLHGAMFRIQDGYCVAGPCAGESLSALHVAVEGDRILIDIPD